MQFYQENSEEDYLRFMKCQRNPRGLKQPGWYNKEVLVRINDKDEGRDFDNRHPYPYVTMELRYDREKDRQVEYTWKSAHTGYVRY